MRFIRIILLVITFLIMHLAWKTDTNFKYRSTVKDSSVESLSTAQFDIEINE